MSSHVNDVIVFYFYNTTTCVYIVAALCLFVIDDGNWMVTETLANILEKWLVTKTKYGNGISFLAICRISV